MWKLGSVGIMIAGEGNRINPYGANISQKVIFSLRGDGAG